MKATGNATDIQLLSGADRLENGKVIATGSVENGTDVYQHFGIVATGYDINDKPVETKCISDLKPIGSCASFSVVLDAGSLIKRVEVRAAGNATDIVLLSGADRLENGKIIATGSVENGTASGEPIGIVATGYDANNKPVETKCISDLAMSGYCKPYSVVLDAGSIITRVEVKATGKATDIELLSCASKNINGTIIPTAVVENGTSSSKSITVTFTGYDANNKPVEEKSQSSSISSGYCKNFSVTLTQSSKITRVAVKTNPQSSQLKVHFLDVGQADCILAKNDQGTILIDTGLKSTSSNVVGYLNQQGIAKIDYLILTHIHSDHIGGAVDVLNNFEVGQVIMPEVPSANTADYNNLISILNSKNIGVVRPIPGMSISIGNANCSILAPNSAEYSSDNDYSIVTKLTYNNTSFMLTGDAETTSENEMISKGYNLSSNLLKIGHHGSNTSTSDQFLQQVNPQFAVIMCGLNNQYGLPTQQIINKLASKNIKIFRTDKCGTIVFTTDGQNLVYNVQPWNPN